VAVKQVRVSDLSGRQADEDQFAKLIVHEHPQYQGPITLDVLPEELGELPESDQYVSIEVIGPGERSGQRALLSVERFNQLAAGGDMQAILMNAVADQQPQRPERPRRRRRGRAATDGRARGKRQVEWGLPHRGRISPEEAAWVQEHFDEVQQLRAARGVPLLDPADLRPRSATACKSGHLAIRTRAEPERSAPALQSRSVRSCVRPPAPAAAIGPISARARRGSPRGQCPQPSRAGGTEERVVRMVPLYVKGEDARRSRVGLRWSR
jgi:hypothetical protein